MQKTTKDRLAKVSTRLLCAAALVLCMVLSLLIVKGTKAAEDGTIDWLYVGLDSLYEDGELTGETVEGATYDPETNVLTLENMTLPYDEEDTGGIYYSGSKDLTIQIKGTVTFPVGSGIVYDGDVDTTGATIRIVGDGRENSKIVQENLEDGEHTTLIDFCMVDEEDPIEMTPSELVISGVSMQTSGGIDSDYGNVTVKDCDWIMECEDAPIRLGRKAGCGNLTVENSFIQIKKFKKTADYPYAITCRSLTLEGCKLFGGASLTRLQEELDPAGSNCSWNKYASYQISETADLWYKLTFDGNSGKAAKTSMWVAAGSACGTLPKATKEHYKLAGWYTKASGGTKVTASTVPTKDQTLYAHWKITGKKTKVKLVTSFTCRGTTYKVTYFKNGMIKSLVGFGQRNYFTYDDQLNYKTSVFYGSHYKNGKKPISSQTYDFEKKKIKIKSNWLGDTFTARFKTNKKGLITKFWISDLGEVSTYTYNSKGYLIKETFKENGKLTEKTTYKRNNKGLITSADSWSKLEGRCLYRFRYTMNGEVPKSFKAHVGIYDDDASFKYTTKTVRKWQKEIIMRQQRMLYSFDYYMGDAMIDIF